MSAHFSVAAVGGLAGGRGCRGPLPQLSDVSRSLGGESTSVRGGGAQVTPARPVEDAGVSADAFVRAGEGHDPACQQSRSSEALALGPPLVSRAAALCAHRGRMVGLAGVAYGAAVTVAGRGAVGIGAAVCPGQDQLAWAAVRVSRDGGPRAPQFGLFREVLGRSRPNVVRARVSIMSACVTGSVAASLARPGAARGAVAA